MDGSAGSDHNYILMAVLLSTTKGRRRCIDETAYRPASLARVSRGCSLQVEGLKVGGGVDFTRVNHFRQVYSLKVACLTYK